MKVRMSQMERSNAQLKQWYDRASTEAFRGEQQPLQSLVRLSKTKVDGNFVVDEALRNEERVSSLSNLRISDF